MTSTPTQSTSASTHPAHTLLSRAHPEQQATAIFTDKIKNKPLLLTPSTTTQTDNRALRRKIRQRKQQYYLQHRKPRPLSAKEKRTLKLHDLKDDEIKYSIYKGLNELWKGYILEVLGLTRDGAVVPDAAKKAVSQGNHGSLIASADFHGMEVEVVRCKDPGRVGLKGIVVRETKGTLLVVTEKDQTRRILKRGAVFMVAVEVPEPEKGELSEEGETKPVRKLVWELHGDQLEFRPVDRAVRKFKWKTMDYL